MASKVGGLSTEITMKSSNQLGVTGILIDALKILFKNLYFPQRIPGSPEYVNLMGKIRSDIGNFMVTEGILIAALWLLFFFSTVATIYASAVTYSGRDLTLKELISRIRATWKSPAITLFYASLINLGCTLLALPSYGLLAMVAIGGSSGWIASAVFGSMVSLVFLCITIYVSLVTTVSLVLSVLEDGCYGMKAIGRAEGLIKGRRLQGVLLIVLCSLVLIPISGFQGFIMGRMAFTEAIRLSIAILLNGISFLVKIFGLTVFTVFYYQCNVSLAEEIDVEQGKGYIKIPNTEV
ncbi:PREDICTED: uncharacterized protein LOC104613167 [Nelumbo nucifera]|uniref:Uncharacterized protein LOC104613167 n=2 Tax=Nelumbo nucifera TaxID=4432 RepID=A0A1U8QCK7_NELNU|nr:PREDICTED: uncharacterized protein LOC104613167 [Nelumbo nucifera]